MNYFVLLEYWWQTICIAFSFVICFLSMQFFDCHARLFTFSLNSIFTRNRISMWMIFQTLAPNSKNIFHKQSKTFHVCGKYICFYWSVVSILTALMFDPIETGPWHFDHVFVSSEITFHIAVYFIFQSHFLYFHSLLSLAKSKAENSWKRSQIQIFEIYTISVSLFDAIVFDFRQFSNLNTDKIQMITIERCERNGTEWDSDCIIVGNSSMVLACIWIFYTTRHTAIMCMEFLYVSLIYTQACMHEAHL